MSILLSLIVLILCAADFYATIVRINDREEFAEKLKKIHQIQKGDGAMDRIVKKSDWKIREMPDKHTTYTIVWHFSEAEMKKLMQGYIPKSMDEKWFTYFEDNKLYIHRSWTGYCIWILSFTPDSDVIEVTSNRNLKQYSYYKKCKPYESSDESDDINDKNLLNDVLNYLISAENRPQWGQKSRL